MAYAVTGAATALMAFTGLNPLALLAGGAATMLMLGS